MKKHIKRSDLLNLGISHRPISSDSDQNDFASILDIQEEFVLSTGGNIVGSNLDTTSFTGYEEWEIMGKHFNIFYLPEENDNKLHLEHLSVADNLGGAVFEGWKLKKRGIRFFAKIRIRSIRNSPGELAGYRMTISDITYKIVYRGKLKKIREKYLSIYNNAFVGIITVSTEDFSITHSNVKAKQILGSQANNLKSAFEEAHRFAIFWKEIQKNEVIQGFEFKTILSNGEEKWISFDCHLHSKEQTIEGVIVDVTLIKKHETEINKLIKEVNTFIYHASHELRSPMSTILGILNLISMEKKSDPVVVNYATMIREKINSQDQLLKDLTGVIYNNTSPLEITDLDIAHEISGVLGEFKEIYSKVKTDTKILIPPIIKTDAIRIRSVLRNVLSNSFKYCCKVDPKIDVRVFEENAKVNISILDNGIGMTDDQLMMIFNLFHRSHEGYPGNGLGLYLVKSILTNLKGEIKIKSKKNIGTEVLLTL